MKILILIALLLLLAFTFVPTEKPVSGTGPGYIPAFQGHPAVGVSGV